MTTPAGSNKSWDDGLLGRLQAFVNVWRNFQGTELAGAQEFLKSLVDIYDVSYLPGTIFEQHPVKIPARKPKAAQGSLFGDQAKVTYTTARMDLYLPKVCVWEMKAPSENDLELPVRSLVR